MIEQPFVSVILPIRNEQEYIKATLNTLSSQDYPSEKVEFIIADGMSDDSTRQIVEAFCSGNKALNVVLLDNPERTVPFGLNRAIQNSRGEVVVRMDSHSVYPPDYISKLVAALFEHEAHNTGGIVKTLPAGQSIKCKSIAVALSHPLGVGNSYFRIGSQQVREVDTVPFGCFRREVFDAVGLFDEDLVRNQDDEFNGRLLNAGYRIVLVPDVVVEYYARDSFSKLYRMYYQYGLYKPLASLKLGRVVTVRQLIPLGFVLSLFLGVLMVVVFQPLIWLLLTGLLFYFGILGVVSLYESYLRKSFLVGHLLISFFILHFSYGLGYLVGAIALLTGRKNVFRRDSLSR
jgi:glycosyltransferase involved in cell wall biosynthesis